MFHRFLAFCFTFIVLAAPAFAVDDAPPAWLRDVAAISIPKYEKNVPAVVLLNDQTVSVGTDGRIVTTTNYAVRILTREGRSTAYAFEGYETTSGKVRDMRAWLIRPTGEVKRYGKDQIADVAGALNDVYNESRAKIISAETDADAGAVFGYTTVSEGRTDFSDDNFAFQNIYPALLARYTLALPAGWQASSITFNHAKVEPTVNGSTYTWELRDLAPIEPEPLSPPITNLAPRLAVSYAPAGGATSSGARAFANWSEVSRWYSELSEPQAAPDDALAGKAQQLTAGAKTELEKIQAIGHYVQNLQYISIQIGIGRYRPHAATEVFAKSYGDCKDKANLMRAMLRAVHIQAYPVLIYSGDATYVREEWASPGQFNHCIIAVKVSDETKTPTVITHPALGRLLIFDATDDNTPVGDLPDYEQNSFALVATASGGVLLRMPVTSADANRIDRQADVQLAPDGSMTANLHEKATGQSAVNFRREFRGLSRPEYTRRIEGWIASGATGAALSKIEPTDNLSDGRFNLDIEYNARNYAQVMQERLMVFKPAIVSRMEALTLTKLLRHHPVVLDAHAFNEKINVKLPAGFEVDEMPDPLKLDTPFGTYVSTYEAKDGQLFFTRSLVLRSATIPVEQYASVRGFFERIRAAEQAPVVLAKK
jgi:hypothetical protein